VDKITIFDDIDKIEAALDLFAIVQTQFNHSFVPLQEIGHDFNLH